jgi:dinuclear metal center YbgI/SA1388 family protein
MEKRVDAILEEVHRIAPLSGAEPWDNVGLLVGAPSWSVKRIAVAVDVTEEIVERAAEKGCSLLLSHHPLFLHPLKNVLLNTREGRIIERSLAHHIALVALHTNWDRSRIGVNVALASALSLKDVRPLLPATEAELWGDGAVGFLDVAIPLQDFCARLREAWNISWVQAYGDPRRVVSRVALLGGSGGGFWRAASASGAHVYVTGDLKYHDRSDALWHGLDLVVVDHGEMEEWSMKHLAMAVREMTGLETEVFPLPRRMFSA